MFLGKYSCIWRVSSAPTLIVVHSTLRDDDEDEDWFIPRGGQEAGRATVPKPKSKDVQIKADKSKKKKKDATKPEDEEDEEVEEVEEVEEGGSKKVKNAKK